MFLLRLLASVGESTEISHGGNLVVRYERLEGRNEDCVYVWDLFGVHFVVFPMAALSSMSVKPRTNVVDQATSFRDLINIIS